MRFRLTIILFLLGVARPVIAQQVGEGLESMSFSPSDQHLEAIPPLPYETELSEPYKISSGSRSDRHPATWRDTLFDFRSGEISFFSGIDGSKQPQDFGVNANLGSRFAVALSAPLIIDRGIGWQVGAAFHSSDNAVRVYELVGQVTDRQQLYTTLGLYQRTEAGFAWGVVYDYLYQESYDSIDAGQFRITLRQQIGCNDWLGFRASIDEHGDSADFLGTNVALQPISQGGVFWTHRWPLRALTTVMAGMSEGHGEDNAVTGPSPSTGNNFVFACDLFIPLSQSFALAGETNLMSPADTGTVDAFLGIEWVPGGGAFSSRLRSFSPLHSVAAPTSMPLDLRM